MTYKPSQWQYWTTCRLLRRRASNEESINKLGPSACQIPDIKLFVHCRFVVVPSIFYRSFLGSRFSSSWSLDFVSFCNLELIGRDIPEAPWGRSRPKLLPSDCVGDGWTPRDMSLKIVTFFDQFFSVFRSMFCSKMTPKIGPKTLKNHFQDRSRF